MHEHRFFNDLNLNASNLSDFNAFENSALEKKSAFKNNKFEKSALEENALKVNASGFNQKKKRLSNDKEKTISKREKKIIFHREEKTVSNREEKFVFIRKEKNSTFINRIKIMQKNNALNELHWLWQFKRKFKKRTIAFREIRRYQKDEKKRYKDAMSEHEDFLISKMRFARFVRKIMQKYSNGNLRIQFAALNALQKVVKTFLSSLFFNMCIIFSHYFTIIDQYAVTNRLIIHVKHVIIQEKNMTLLVDLMRNIKYMNDLFRKKRHQSIWYDKCDRSLNLFNDDISNAENRLSWIKCAFALFCCIIP